MLLLSLVLLMRLLLAVATVAAAGAVAPLEKLQAMHCLNPHPLQPVLPPQRRRLFPLSSPLRLRLRRRLRLMCLVVLLSLLLLLLLLLFQLQTWHLQLYSMEHTQIGNMYKNG